MPPWPASHRRGRRNPTPCLERDGLVRILDGNIGAVKRSVTVPKARGITHVGDHWIVLAGDRLLRLGAG